MLLAIIDQDLNEIKWITDEVPINVTVKRHFGCQSRCENPARCLRFYLKTDPLDSSRNIGAITPCICPLFNQNKTISEINIEKYRKSGISSPFSSIYITFKSHIEMRDSSTNSSDDAPLLKVVSYLPFGALVKEMESPMRNRRTRFRTAEEQANDHVASTTEDERTDNNMRRFWAVLENGAGSSRSNEPIAIIQQNGDRVQQLSSQAKNLLLRGYNKPQSVVFPQKREREAANSPNPSSSNQSQSSRNYSNNTSVVNISEHNLNVKQIVIQNLEALTNLLNENNEARPRCRSFTRRIRFSSNVGPSGLVITQRMVPGQPPIFELEYNGERIVINTHREQSDNQNGEPSVAEASTSGNAQQEPGVQQIEEEQAVSQSFPDPVIVEPESSSESELRNETTSDLTRTGQEETNSSMLAQNNLEIGQGEAIQEPSQEEEVSSQNRPFIISAKKRVLKAPQKPSINKLKELMSSRKRSREEQNQEEEEEEETMGTLEPKPAKLPNLHIIKEAESSTESEKYSNTSTNVTETEQPGRRARLITKILNRSEVVVQENNINEPQPGCSKFKQENPQGSGSRSADIEQSSENRSVSADNNENGTSQENQSDISRGEFVIKTTIDEVANLIMKTLLVGNGTYPVSALLSDHPELEGTIHTILQSKPDRTQPVRSLEEIAVPAGPIPDPLEMALAESQAIPSFGISETMNRNRSSVQRYQPPSSYRIPINQIPPVSRQISTMGTSTYLPTNIQEQQRLLQRNAHLNYLQERRQEFAQYYNRYTMCGNPQEPRDMGRFLAPHFSMHNNMLPSGSQAPYHASYGMRNGNFNDYNHGSVSLAQYRFQAEYCRVTGRRAYCNPFFEMNQSQFCYNISTCAIHNAQNNIYAAQQRNYMLRGHQLYASIRAEQALRDQMWDINYGNSQYNHFSSYQHDNILNNFPFVIPKEEIEDEDQSEDGENMNSTDDSMENMGDHNQELANVNRFMERMRSMQHRIEERHEVELLERSTATERQIYECMVVQHEDPSPSTTNNFIDLSGDDPTSEAETLGRIRFTRSDPGRGFFGAGRRRACFPISWPMKQKTVITIHDSSSEDEEEQ